MKKLRILTLMEEKLVPPENTQGINTKEAEWRMEYDVLKTLRKMGHDAVPLGIQDELRPIRTAIDEYKPHIVFNLLEDFADVPVFDQNVVAYLELIRIPYTGCNPRGLLLARDKALSKQILSYHRIPIPSFVVFPIGRTARLPKRLTFPVIVKSLTKEASTGISQASVVDDEAKLKERVQFIHESIGTDAIVERYIPGRELYVGMIGNQRIEVFPVWEMFFEQLPEGAHPIATGRAKWNSAYQIRRGIKTGPAEISEDEEERVQHVCKRVYKALGLSGYARMDIRMDPDGNFFVLEANPNPQLANGEDLACAALEAGLSYEDLLQRIINLGLRWRPAGTEWT